MTPGIGNGLHEIGHADSASSEGAQVMHNVKSVRQNLCDAWFGLVRPSMRMTEHSEGSKTYQVGNADVLVGFAFCADDVKNPVALLQILGSLR